MSTYDHLFNGAIGWLFLFTVISIITVTVVELIIPILVAIVKFIVFKIQDKYYEHKYADKEPSEKE